MYLRGFWKLTQIIIIGETTTLDLSLSVHSECGQRCDSKNQRAQGTQQTNQGKFAMEVTNLNSTANTSDATPLKNAKADENLLIYIGVGSSVSIFGSLTNLLFILSLVKQKRLRTVSNYLLGYLAVVDMLVCCVSIPLNLRVRAGTTSVVSCLFENKLTFILPHLSMQVQCLISSNRYFLVTKSRLVYRKWFSRRRVVVYAAVGWTLAIISALAVDSAIDTPALVTTEFCNSRNDVTETKKLNNYVLSFVIFMYFLVAVGFYGGLIKFLRQNSLRLDMEKRRESRTSVTLFILLCVFFVSLLASPLALYINSLFKDDVTRMDSVDQIVASIILMNYCVNPVFYGFRIKQFKEATKSTLFCCLPTRVHTTDRVQGPFAITVTHKNEAWRDGTVTTQLTVPSVC